MIWNGANDPQEAPEDHDEPEVTLDDLYAVMRRNVEQRDAALARASAEHQQRVNLVNAMSELLPQIGLVGMWCRACARWSHTTGHTDRCPYVAALAAVAEADRSVE